MLVTHDHHLLLFCEFPPLSSPTAQKRTIILTPQRLANSAPKSTRFVPNEAHSRTASPASRSTWPTHGHHDFSQEGFEEDSILSMSHRQSDMKPHLLDSMTRGGLPPNPGKLEDRPVPENLGIDGCHVSRRARSLQNITWSYLSVRGTRSYSSSHTDANDHTLPQAQHATTHPVQHPSESPA